MPSATKPIQRLIALLIVALVGLSLAGPAAAQTELEGRLVRSVTFEGLGDIPEQKLRNAVRTEVGQPYSAKTAQADIVRITFLGGFETIEEKFTQNEDGSINLIFALKEQKILASLSFQGNELFDDEQLYTQVLLEVGDPIDTALIDSGATLIQAAYAEKGYFVASVKYDKAALGTERALIYQVTEGPRVRITDLRFEGNTVFDDDRLYSRIVSEERFWPFVSGFMDRAKLEQDVQSIRQYYNDRGYLTCRVGRRIELSPRQNRAVVVFEINEGPQQTVRDVKVQFTKDGAPTDDQLMSAEQIRYVVDLVKGGIYSNERLERSRLAVQLWYGEIGFINTQVAIDDLPVPGQPLVDVLVQIEEGSGPVIVGDVVIIGLTRTDQKVLLRRIRGLEPGRPVNLRGLNKTTDLVRQSIWFSNGTVTALGDPYNPVRDYLIQAQEKNTGTFSIGAGLSSDAGVFGAISLEQRNFDVTDWPESFDEFIAQRAFIGAGQTFNITIAPGNDTSNYSISLREPYLFESDYFLDVGINAFQSVREDFDEGRIGFRSGVGRRLGDVWTGSARVRIEQVEISDIEVSAPTDVFAVAGSNMLTSVSASLLRSTTDSNITPSRGSRISLGVEQFGALGGEFDFTRFSLGYDQFWTLDEDFLGRKTILSFQIDAGYIPQDVSEAPLFERFYSGGRNFRGFAFRGVGPRGIRNDTLLVGDDPVGGQFQFISRLQYEFPVYEKLVRWAVFTDQGTIQNDIGFDEWRVAVGTGIRLSLPFFGQVPIAIDVGIPLLDQEGDETQLISFSFEVPFN